MPSKKLSLFKPDGFTLLEVLVAVTVSSILFTVLISGFGRNLRNLSLADGYTTASFLAKDVMVKLENEKELKVGVSRGKFGEDYPEYRWVANITEDASQLYYMLELRVIFSKSGGDREVVVRSIILKKKPST